MRNPAAATAALLPASTPPKGGRIVEIAEPRRPRLRLLLDRDSRVTPGGSWSMFGRKVRLDGVMTERFAVRVSRPEYVKVID